MMNMIIKIVVFSFGSDGARKVCYQNSVDLLSDLSFDYQSVVKVLRILYPKSDGVEFCVI